LDGSAERIVRVCLDRESCRLPLLDQANVAFVHRNHDLHPCEIGSQQQELGRRKACGNRLADIDVALDHHARDRRCNGCVLEVLLGAVQVHLGAAEVGRSDVAGICRSIQIRAGGDAFFGKLAEALEIALSLVEFRLVADEIGPGFPDCNLEQRGVKPGDDLALVHRIVEIHQDLVDDPGHLGAHLDSGDRLQRPGCRNDGLDVTAFHGDEAVGACLGLGAVEVEAECSAGGPQRHQNVGEPHDLGFARRSHGSFPLLAQIPSQRSCQKKWTLGAGS